MKEISIQDQYSLIKEGKFAKDIFLKNVKRMFPDAIPGHFNYDQSLPILRQRGIIYEKTDIGGVVTKGKSVYDWKSVLSEAKVEEKEVSKEVRDVQDKAYNSRDPKNIDNIYGQRFLVGYYAELKDPANATKTVDELKDIVAKNLQKDILWYVKNAQFGVKGVGYTDKFPGLTASKSDQMIPVPDQAKIIKSKTTLSDQEKNTGDPKKVKKMTMDAQSSKGVKKMKTPKIGMKKIRLKLKEGRSYDETDQEKLNYIGHACNDDDDLIREIGLLLNIQFQGFIDEEEIFNFIWSRLKKSGSDGIEKAYKLAMGDKSVKESWEGAEFDTGKFDDGPQPNDEEFGNDLYGKTHPVEDEAADIYHDIITWPTSTKVDFTSNFMDIEASGDEELDEAIKNWLDKASWDEIDRIKNAISRHNREEKGMPGYSGLDEDMGTNDPMLMKLRAEKDKRKAEPAKSKTKDKKISDRRLEIIDKLEDELTKLVKQRKELEGGVESVANAETGELNDDGQLSAIDKKIKKIKDGLLKSYKKFPSTDNTKWLNDQIMSASSIIGMDIDESFKDYLGYSDSYKAIGGDKELAREIGAPDRIPGGKASGLTIKDLQVKYPGKDLKSQLKKGIKVEMEHTTDPRIALEITMDHLMEDPKYYDKLDKAKLEEQGTNNGVYQNLVKNKIKDYINKASDEQLNDLSKYLIIKTSTKDNLLTKLDDLSTRDIVKLYNKLKSLGIDKLDESTKGQKPAKDEMSDFIEYCSDQELIEAMDFFDINGDWEIGDNLETLQDTILREIEEMSDEDAEETFDDLVEAGIIDIDDPDYDLGKIPQDDDGLWDTDEEDDGFPSDAERNMEESKSMSALRKMIREELDNSSREQEIKDEIGEEAFKAEYDLLMKKDPNHDRVIDVMYDKYFMGGTDLDEAKDDVASLKAELKSINDKLDKMIEDGAKLGLGDPLVAKSRKLAYKIKSLKESDNEIIYNPKPGDKVSLSITYFQGQEIYDLFNETRNAQVKPEFDNKEDLKKFIKDKGLKLVGKIKLDENKPKKDAPEWKDTNWFIQLINKGQKDETKPNERQDIIDDISEIKKQYRLKRYNLVKELMKKLDFEPRESYIPHEVYQFIFS